MVLCARASLAMQIAEYKRGRCGPSSESVEDELHLPRCLNIGKRICDILEFLFFPSPFLLPLSTLLLALGLAQGLCFDSQASLLAR